MTARAPMVLAAGGTGGHMFPAEALARELLDRGERVVLVTDRRGQAFGQALPAVETVRIPAASPGGGLASKARAAVLLGLGTLAARRALGRLGPRAVVGFGGYPAVPTVLAAHRLHVPIALHEQNAVLGRANRWLARHAEVVATSFPSVKGLAATDSAKVRRTGNPVRPAIARLRRLAYAPPAADGPLHLLVLGGSQGARVFSDVVPAALALLPPDLRTRLALSQQCRPEDLDRTAAAYAAAGIAPALASFFTDVPERLARAHLVICRAGASTVAELAAAGRPALLVPYPFAADDHQTANAAALTEAGAGWLLPQDRFTPESLAERLAALFAAPETLARAAASAHGFGTDRAAAALADAVLALAAQGAPATPPDGAREAPA